MSMPVFLTQREKKKLSRKARLEKELAKQELVKYGLAPAPLPKIKMSNYQAIMAKDAVTDPTGTEIIAKAIIQKRLNDHEKRNKERHDNKESNMAKQARKSKE